MLDSQSIALFLNCYDFMSRTEKRVAEVLSDFWLANRTSKVPNSKIHPSINRIAQKSRCCARSVNRFLKKYQFLFTKVKGRYLWKGKISDPLNEIERQGRFLANEYDLNQGFFELLAFLKYKKITKNWKKVRLSVVTNVNQNQELTLFIYGFEKWVMNIKMSHGLSEKCRTISCIPFSSKKNLDYKVPPTSVGPSTLIYDYRLKKDTLRFADRFCTYSVVKDARNDYDWFKKTNTIYSPDGLMKNLLKNQINRHIQLASKELKSMYSQKL